MDELISLILHGIDLAKELEPLLRNLPNSHQENVLLPKLDDIIRVFGSARDRINAQTQQLHHLQMEPSFQEQWIRGTMMELLQSRFVVDHRSSGSSSGGLAMESAAGSSGLDVQPSMGVSSSSQRTRRRSNDADKRTMRVPAPKMGNTEIPPEDGYTWRKYGQKEILGSRYPRGYYRCTHQKMYQCPAKKQVQRLDDDPYTFEVTYRGDHTCHMSATAPSIPPPQPPPQITQEMTQSIATQPPPPWLEFSLGGGGGGGSSSGAGPSTVRFGKEAEYPVADMADVMFNSGSSSTNSMELIFTSLEDNDKWESGEKKS